MEPEHHKNELTAETGRRGGLKRAERQSAQERSALARHTARPRWHPREAQAIRERAQEITQLVKQALKDGRPTTPHLKPAYSPLKFLLQPLFQQAASDPNVRVPTGIGREGVINLFDLFQLLKLINCVSYNR